MLTYLSVIVCLIISGKTTQRILVKTPKSKEIAPDHVFQVRFATILEQIKGLFNAQYAITNILSLHIPFVFRSMRHLPQTYIESKFNKLVQGRGKQNQNETKRSARLMKTENMKSKHV